MLVSAVQGGLAKPPLLGSAAHGTRCQISSSGIGQQALPQTLCFSQDVEYRPMAAPFAERRLADPTDDVLFKGCHGVLDRTTDGVDPQNAQPALHCDRGRNVA